MTAALMVAFNKKIATEFAEKIARRNLPSRSLTPQQEAFHESFVLQEGSMLGEAVAGSGKTHILLKSALSTPFSWECKTLHGLGYKAWMDKIGRRCQVSDSKMFGILKDLVKDDPDFPSDDFSEILQLIKLAKNYGIVPDKEGIVPDDPAEWEDLAFHHDIDFHPRMLLIVREALKISIAQSREGVIDFADMIYMPVCFFGVFTKFPLVVVDEAQDLSSIQHEMLRRVLAKDGMLVAAGDRNQAIYGFRGALTESIPTLIEDFQMKLFPLTVSFRCPQVVVEEAQRDVPHIEAAPSAPEGILTRFGADHPLSLASIPQTVLCRLNAPIVELALHLIAEGRGATIAGRDIGKSLSRLITKISPRETTIDAFLPRLTDFIQKEIARKPSREGPLTDKLNALSVICRRAKTLQGGLATTKTATSIIKQLYEDDSRGVLLSTIHKAKGLEWQDVLILAPSLIPSKYATQSWQLQQEHNLRYVAVTRAQNHLNFAERENIQ